MVATLAVDTTTTYEECSSTTGAAGEGLFNQASLTVRGETTTDEVCEDIAGDLMIEKSDGDVELADGDGPFEYQLTVTNVGGASTGSPVIVTDVLPDEFQWVDFPDTAGEFPFCTQAGQVLTCEIDSTLVDAGGESTSFLVSAELRDGVAESIDGYENLSYVDSPGDPAPSEPVCEPQAASSAASFDALVGVVATPTNNVACDRTPVRPSEVDRDRAADDHDASHDNVSAADRAAGRAATDRFGRLDEHAGSGSAVARPRCGTHAGRATPRPTGLTLIRPQRRVRSTAVNRGSDAPSGAGARCRRSRTRRRRR